MEKSTNTNRIRSPFAGTTDEKQGRYATAEEAVKTKNEPLITLLKKLNVKAGPAS